MRQFPRRDGTFGGKVPRHDHDSSTTVLRKTASDRESSLVHRAAGLALLVAAALGSPALGEAAAPAPTGTQDATAPPAAPVTSIEEELTVTDTRLPDIPDDRLRVPAHVTVIDREAIERSGARTLQDLLSLEAGVVVFDVIGNDVQKSFDLRGFGGEAGTRVFLDGAPLNEPRNNGAPLEHVPLLALDRIEITRGSVAALAGGGSEAGIVNLFTRRGEGAGGAVSAAAGDFSTYEVDASGRSDFGAGDLFVAGGWEETDGFRDNAGGDLERIQGSFGWDFGPERRLSISLLRSDVDFGSPGALTLAEARADPEQAPFNQLDFIQEELEQATLNFSSALRSSLHLQANLFARDRGDEILSTGRAAPVFGGFASESEADVYGSTVQFGYGHDAGLGSNRIVAGAEWLDGDTDTAGFFTSPSDPGTVDPSGLSSDNIAERRTLGLYAHDTWQPAARLTFAVGARWDDDQVGYEERFPDQGNDAQRDFEEVSLRGGVTWSVSSSSAVYVSYGEAFLPPTVEQLFSFPLFGSNPTLEPEDSQSWELGYRRRIGAALDLDAVAFRIRSENEILFDPDSDLGLFGANVNAGEARREGLELALRGRAGRRARPFATVTLVDAELTSGDDQGNRLPLVPEERVTAGVDLDFGRAFTLRAEALYVGEQVLQNDEANAQQELPAYNVVNLRAGWRPGGRDGSSDGWAGGLHVFVEARNVLDEEYATRGIFAFDFSTFINEIFLTPAPGRRFLGGVGWEF